MNQTPTSESEPIEIPLRDAAWAALLAWLIPGAGHIYQRRYTKGILFSVCILGTFFTGLIMGHGQVVYASWRPNDYRWQYFAQLGVGLPAMPALIQNLKTRGGGDPFFANRGYLWRNNEVIPVPVDGQCDVRTGPMSPPPGPIPQDTACVLALWHDELDHFFEIGTLYTVVAGILNLLAVYDAFAGPAFPEEEQAEDEDPEDDEH